jgi:hypothetical protein
MIYSFLADLLVVLHLTFILFVLFGSLLVLKWERLFWFHLPAIVWGITIEISGWICPLTPLEVDLRKMAGEQGYSGSFIMEYLIPILYPSGLTREIQWVLGVIVVLTNLVLYAFILKKRSSFKNKLNSDNPKIQQNSTH